MKRFGVIMAFLCFVIFFVESGMHRVAAETEAGAGLSIEDSTEDSTEESAEEDTEEVVMDYTAPFMVLALGEQEERVTRVDEKFFFGELDEKGKPWIAFSLKVADGAENGTSAGLNRVTVELNGEAAYEKIYGDNDELIYDDEIIFDLSAIATADKYVGEITVVDNAGNMTTQSLEIYKDTEGPIISEIHLADAVTIVADTYFYNSAVEIEAVCEDAEVGVEAVEWGTIDLENVSEGKEHLMPAETIEVDENGLASFLLEALEETAFEEVVYVRAIDLFGNIGESMVLNPIVIETQEQHDAVDEIEPHLLMENVTETPYTDASGKPLYAGDVQSVLKLQTTATDITNGVKEIIWEVASEKGVHTELGGTASFIGAENEYIDGAWQIEEGTDYTKIVDGEIEIALTNLDANNVVVRVVVTDFSGNQTAEEVFFSVDQTTPMVTVEFDDSMPDAEYTNIYNNKRTARISVTDRNLDMKQISINITNSEGVIPENGEWGFSIDEDNPEQTTCTSTITFGADGDYTIEVSSKDMAGHVTSIRNIPEFTIDMTNPVISVNYQNQDAQNDKYFAAPQVAMIQITEHNFAEERIAVKGMAFPVLSSWKSDGDVHIATIVCNVDGQYQFDIEYTDKAGNKAESYSGEEFYVDMTAPEIEITGVEDKSANNGTIAPSISFSDANFDGESIEVMLSGANHGEAALAYDVLLQEQGAVYEYSDIPWERERDDIYTLTATVADLAGNSSKETITFSANRFGSVYVFGDALKNIAGSYVQDEMDVKLTEVNVDSLRQDSIRVVLDKNGIARDLERDTDYSVTEIGGSGIWHQYEYKIDKSIFEGDGRYIISVFSKDAAGNMNENKDETKQAEIIFGIDKTAPNVIPIDITSGEQYDAEEKTVTLTVNDNFVLEDVEVFVDDKKSEVLSDGDSYTFQIPNASTRQNINIIAIDAAGNRTNYVISDVLVTTNAWIRWYNDKRLFFGSILGTVMLVGVCIIGITGIKMRCLTGRKVMGD